MKKITTLFLFILLLIPVLVSGQGYVETAVPGQVPVPATGYVETPAPNQQPVVASGYVEAETVDVAGITVADPKACGYQGNPAQISIEDRFDQQEGTVENTKRPVFYDWQIGEPIYQASQYDQAGNLISKARFTFDDRPLNLHYVVWLSGTDLTNYILIYQLSAPEDTSVAYVEFYNAGSKKPDGDHPCAAWKDTIRHVTNWFPALEPHQNLFTYPLG